VIRTLAAVAIAPLAVVPVLIVLFGPWAVSNGGVRTLAGIVGPALVVAYPMVILFGLPMHLALMRARATRARDYALAGVLLGAVPVIGYVVVAVVFDSKFELAAMPATLARNTQWGALGVVVFGLSAAVVGLAFRAVLIAGRPTDPLVR